MKNYAEKRKEICNNCEYNGKWICKKCGCILPLKISIPSQKCPIGKWEQEKDRM